MEPFHAFDANFDDVAAGGRLVKVVDVDAHEGPVYVAGEDALYFTTLPAPTDVPLPGSLRVAIKRLALDGDRFPLEVERLVGIAGAGVG
jgi:gluconolactonase